MTPAVPRLRSSARRSPARRRRSDAHQGPCPRAETGAPRQRRSGTGLGVGKEFGHELLSGTVQDQGLRRRHPHRRLPGSRPRPRCPALVHLEHRQVEAPARRRPKRLLAVISCGAPSVAGTPMTIPSGSHLHQAGTCRVEGPRRRHRCRAAPAPIVACRGHADAPGAESQKQRNDWRGRRGACHGASCVPCVTAESMRGRCPAGQRSSVARPACRR